MGIEFKQVGKDFDDKKVLEGISFQIADGEVVCFTGESGSGKTTVFRLMMGLLVPDRGEVTVGSERFSAVFQENRLFNHLSPLKNIRVACDYKISADEVIEHLTQILPVDCARKPVANLSGGMKRRVAILRAILADSEVIIMDEPFQGLDEDTRAKVIAYIKTYRNGRTLIYSTHDHEEYDLLGGSRIELTEVSATYRSPGS